MVLNSEKCKLIGANGGWGTVSLPERIITGAYLKFYHMGRLPLCRVQPVTALKETETLVAYILHINPCYIW